MKSRNIFFFKKIFIIVFFVFSSFFSVNANGPVNTDSIYRSIQKLPEDTNKIFSYARFIETCIANRNDVLVNAAFNMGFALSQKLNSKRGKMQLFYYKGMYNNEGLQLEYLNRTLALANELKDIQYKAAALSGLGDIAIINGEFTKAMELRMQSLDLSEKAGLDQYSVYSYYEVGMLFRDEGKYTEALEYLKKALLLANKIDKLEARTQFTAAICGVYIMTGNLDSAWYFLQQNTRLSTELNMDDLKFQNIRKYGQFYAAQKKYAKADSCYSELMKFQINRGLNLPLKETAEWCDILIKLHKHKEALELIPEAMKNINTGKLQTKVVCLNTFAEVYELSGRTKEALEFYKEYQRLKDSLIKKQKVTEFSEMEVKFKTNEKEKEIRLLNAEQGVKNAEIKKQKLIKNFTVLGIALVIVISFFVITRQQLKRKAYRQGAELRRMQEIEMIRSGISRDLHDDIGSTLSSINIMSTVAGSRPEQSPQMIKNIQESSRRLLDSMSDIVWAVNPENDLMENILVRMNMYAAQMLEPRGIKFALSSEGIEHIHLPMEKRRDFYLIFKEALNNILKYSECSEVGIFIGIRDKTMLMKITDNGKGFVILPNLKEETGGNGLKNMKKRALNLMGDITILSAAGKGTSIELQMPIT